MINGLTDIDVLKTVIREAGGRDFADRTDGSVWFTSPGGNFAIAAIIIDDGSIDMYSRLWNRHFSLMSDTIIDDIKMWFERIDE